MIQKIRKSIPYLLPIVAAVLILGLILSRVIESGSPLPEPEISISAAEAEDFAGSVAEVCGQVASANYLQNVNGKPTFLNLDEAYPNQLFTVVIFGDNRPRFRSPPEQMYLNRNICVSGTIRIHEGIPQIVVSNPEQIALSGH